MIAVYELYASWVDELLTDKSVAGTFPAHLVLPQLDSVSRRSLSPQTCVGLFLNGYT